jgi:hypothetical protein
MRRIDADLMRPTRSMLSANLTVRIDLIRVISCLLRSFEALAFSCPACFLLVIVHSKPPPLQLVLFRVSNTISQTPRPAADRLS